MNLSFLNEGIDQRSNFEKRLWEQTIRASLSQSNFIYLNKPKCACTTVKRILWEAEAYTHDFVSKYRQDIDRVNLMKNNPRSPFTFDVHRIKKLETPFVFSFVRNPFSRIFSCYLDKAIFPYLSNQKTIKQLRKLRIKERFVTFTEFLEFVHKLSDWARDPHYQSMKQLHSSTRWIPCDFIGYLENFSNDISHVLSCIYPFNYEEIATKIDTSNTNENKFYKYLKQNYKIEEYMGDREIELIQQIYSCDFKEFGYSTRFDDYKKMPNVKQFYNYDFLLKSSRVRQNFYEGRLSQARHRIKLIQENTKHIQSKI